MEITLHKTTIFLLLLIHTIPYNGNSAEAPKWIKSGYWLTVSEFPLHDLDSSLFTHLFCGFASINSSTFRLSIPSSDLQYFDSFTSTVKLKNPFIQTLLSVGDSRISPVFFSMITKFSSRKTFINSCIKTVLLYGFNGLDLFYFKPNTTLDSSNMAALFDEFRSTLNSYDKDLILTMGINYVPTNYVNDTITYVNYPVNSIQKNFDWVHMLSFDYFMPKKDNFSYPHAALYDPHNPHINTNYGINQWISKGLAPNKILIGLPYHGWAWTLLNPDETQVGGRASGPGVTLDGSMSYSYIKNYVKSYGVDIVYNSTYVENYCTFGSFWVGFDDEEAISAKVVYARSKGLGGYSVFQLGNDDKWVLSQAAAEITGKSNRSRRLLLLKTLIPVACLCCLGLIIYIHKARLLRYARPAKNDAENFSCESSSDLKKFRFKDIRAATNDFSILRKLGEGGYGPVYKGKLKTGQEIAVKRLSKVSSQGLEEFQNEVLLTARLQHVNLVKVMGFCIERDEKMLVYEYLPNGSLDSYLFDPVKRWQLDWGKRAHIIEGIIQGLLYLQEYSRVTIIHRDIKASNILLDKDLHPKISDFGMARIFQKDVYEANTSRIVGTYGFVPPEYVKQGLYSTKYDVYSFGVLLLQVISGKRTSQFYGANEDINYNLLEYAYELFIDGQGNEFVDPVLDDSKVSGSKCDMLMMRCLQIALLCVQVKQEDRPSIIEISSMLKNEGVPIKIPKRPAFSTKPDEDAKPSSCSQDLHHSNYDSVVSELEPR